MSVSVKGLNKLIKTLDKIGITTDKVMADASMNVGEEIRKKIVVSIQTGTKSGIVYGKHHSSAEGEAPATNSGNLVRSMDVKKLGRMGAKVGSFGKEAEYGLYLEFGTSIMGARPWLEPARKKSEAFAKKAFANALRDKLRNV